MFYWLQSWQGGREVEKIICFVLLEIQNVGE